MIEIKLDANKIKNDTIHKLNRLEIGDLGLCNVGVYLYKGELKSRIKDFKTVKINDWQTNFERDDIRLEVIKIAEMGDEKGIMPWAVRLFDINKNSYEEFWMILEGCRLFK